ncbi:hypothetical protein ACC718_14970 [Rhizobium ruizarguesonis]
MEYTYSEFDNEIRFEEHIRNIVYRSIELSGIDAKVIVAKRLTDIIICRNDRPSIFFLEIKYHKRKHFRLGIGHGNGGGFQPEILRHQPAYLESQMRWIIGSEERVGDRFLLKNSDIARYVSGGQIGKKFNNIKTSVFRDFSPLSDDALLHALTEWLLATKLVS